jgi:chromosome segregation ATPase
MAPESNTAMAFESEIASLRAAAASLRAERAKHVKDLAVLRAELDAAQHEIKRLELALNDECSSAMQACAELAALRHENDRIVGVIHQLYPGSTL